MPFQRPTLSELRTLVAQDIASALPGADALLRFSNLRIMGDAQAALAQLHLSYLDWIAKQAVPFTATDEYLEAWAALKDVTRNPAGRAVGTVRFTGVNGTNLPTGVALARADGKTFTTTASGVVAGGSVTVAAIADEDPTGLTGAWGDMATGTALTLSQSIAGIDSTGAVVAPFVGGSDLESDDSVRERMLAVFKNPAHGGSAGDFVNWALDVAGVTRAWCVPSGMGAGTVQVFVMLDVVQAAFGGFPQGTNGVSASEPRDPTVATGDQLVVANALFTLQPVTSLVYVLAPSPYTVNFTISGLASASTELKDEVKDAIRSCFVLYGKLAGTTNLSLIESAIAAVPGTSGFIIVTPTTNITSGAGQIPVLGTVTWT